MASRKAQPRELCKTSRLVRERHRDVSVDQRKTLKLALAHVCRCDPGEFTALENKLTTLRHQKLEKVRTFFDALERNVLEGQILLEWYNSEQKLYHVELEEGFLWLLIVFIFEVPGRARLYGDALVLELRRTVDQCTDEQGEDIFRTVVDRWSCQEALERIEVKFYL